MSEMVERVARAICMARGVMPDIPYGDDPAPNPDAPPAWHVFVPAAEAAIAAMREPLPEMTEAAAQTLFRENKGVEYAPAIGWRAMIDAALKDP